MAVGVALRMRPNPNPVDEAHGCHQHADCDPEQVARPDAHLFDQKAGHLTARHGPEDGPEREEGEDAFCLGRIENGSGEEPVLARGEDAVDRDPDVEQEIDPIGLDIHRPAQRYQRSDEHERRAVDELGEPQPPPDAAVEDRHGDDRERRGEEHERQALRAELDEEEAVPRRLQQVQRDEKREVVDEHHPDERAFAHAEVEDRAGRGFHHRRGRSLRRR